MESKEAEASLAGYSRKVTPLAFIHKRVRPLDGWMVVANPYHQNDPGEHPVGNYILLCA